MKIFGLIRCGLCERTCKKLFYYVHLISDATCIVLFFIKMITFLLYKSRTYGQIGNKPCTVCSHSAKSHLVIPDYNTDNCKEPFGLFDCLFKVKISIKEPPIFQECVTCFILNFRNKTDRQRLLLTHDYKPMNNLQYLEWKYEKGVKNETAESK